MGYSFQLARNESSLFTVYNFVNAKESLKGQCHEIFDFRFFHESVSPNPLSIPLGPFQICSKICGNIGISLTLVANLPPVSLIKFAKVAAQPSSFAKSTNSWAQYAIANPQISEICESANFF